MLIWKAAACVTAALITATLSNSVLIMFPQQVQGVQVA